MTLSNLWTIPFMLSLGGCLIGCTDPVKHQFGYTEPAVEFHHGAFSGTHARASTLINGVADIQVDPETQKIIGFHVSLQSDPREVYDKQASRVTANFLAGRQLEYDFKIEAAKVITAAINDLAKSLVTLGIGLGSPAGGALTGIGRMLQDGIEAAGGQPTMEQLIDLLDRANLRPTTQPS